MINANNVSHVSHSSSSIWNTAKCPPSRLHMAALLPSAPEMNQHSCEYYLAAGLLCVSWSLWLNTNMCTNTVTWNTQSLSNWCWHWLLHKTQSQSTGLLKTNAAPINDLLRIWSNKDYSTDFFKELWDTVPTKFLRLLLTCWCLADVSIMLTNHVNIWSAVNTMFSRGWVSLEIMMNHLPGTMNNYNKFHWNPSGCKKKKT